MEKSELIKLVIERIKKDLSENETYPLECLLSDISEEHLEYFITLRTLYYSVKLETVEHGEYVLISVYYIEKNKLKLLCEITKREHFSEIEEIETYLEYNFPHDKFHDSTTFIFEKI